VTVPLLNRASRSRPCGEWNDHDYDVLADGVVVGRIMKAAAAPVGTWLWTTLAFGHYGGSHADPRLRGDARGRDGRLRQGGSEPSSHLEESGAATAREPSAWWPAVARSTLLARVRITDAGRRGA